MAPADVQTIMEYTFRRPFRSLLAGRGFLLGLAFLVCGSAGAQELLKNGDFESPFPGSDPTGNWTVVYVDGGPGDFAIAGPSTEAHAGKGAFGAHLRPNNFNSAHAYFKQIVTNLTPGATYTLTAQRMQAGFQKYVGGRLRVYACLVSGSSSNVVFGNGTSAGPYSLTITASASRQIEVQLHLWKACMSNESSNDMKHTKCSGWFDDFSLRLTP